MVKSLRSIHALRVATISRAARELLDALRRAARERRAGKPDAPHAQARGASGGARAPPPRAPAGG